MSTLATALALATERHAGQVDKAGVDYIQHPMRVMQKLDSEEAKIVAVLHDILEDTATTSEELAQLGFSEAIVKAIYALTKQPNEHRFEAMQRTARNALACQVKLADLDDNMDLSRLPNPSSKDLKRMAQYQQVQHYLQQALRMYQHLATLGLPEDYPEFHFEPAPHYNYQYVINALFDLRHAMGGCQIDLPQEWWILFEDVGHLFAQYQEHQQQPPLEMALQMILDTDQEFLDGQFNDTSSIILLRKILTEMIEIYFGQFAAA